MMLQRLVFAVAVGLLATAGGIALTPRVALNTRPQLRFAHAAPAPLGCGERKWFPDAAIGRAVQPRGGGLRVGVPS